MIIITGGAGFIGSCLVWQLNEAGIDDICVVDALGCEDKWKNLAKRQFHTFVHKDNLFDYMQAHKSQVDAVFHMGACSSTTEKDADFLMDNNFNYSVKIFQFCAEQNVPMIYASSAATYGDGSLGYIDDHELSLKLRPINKYGFSKYLFDCWVLKQQKAPPFWAGLKFFNVFGPQEYHKGSQASVVYHAFPQIKEKKNLKLFKSYHKDFAHGEQKRDFVYIKDVVKVMEFLLVNRKTAKSGVYNIGTGKARKFVDLGKAAFSALKTPENFEWIEMPDNVRNQYQYFTEASLERLRESAGYTEEFTSLEEGVNDYVVNYLTKDDPYL